VCFLFFVCVFLFFLAFRLVAARHLHHFGFKTTVHYPKHKSDVDIYNRLVKQAKQLELPFLEELPASLNQFDVVVDGVFGYSFTGDIR
jgi:NAD(P)H-hydrate epimerase